MFTKNVNKMKLNFPSGLFTAILLSAAVLTSCDESDSDTPNPAEQYYSLGIVMADDFSSYLLSTPNLESGSVSPIGNGVELPSAEFIQSENYIYFFSRTEKKFFQYELRPDGTTVPSGSLLVTAYITDRAYSQNLIDKNTILVMDPIVWGEPEIKWFTIKIPEFEVGESGTLTLPTKAKNETENWSGNLGRGVLHGNKFIMGTVFYDFDGNFAEGTHAVVIDYPSMTNPTLIETQLTSAELGIFTNNNMIRTANGDVYIAAYRGFYGKPTDNDVHGSILRIKNGEYDFDESYFLDLTDVMGESTQIMQLDALEGQKAMGMLFNDSEIGSWDNLDNDHYYYALIDLPNKTVNKFNVPKADVRLARKPLITDAKYITYHKLLSSGTTNVLEIDYNDGADAFTTGTLIEGANIQGYSVAKHPVE